MVAKDASQRKLPRNLTPPTKMRRYLEEVSLRRSHVRAAITVRRGFGKNG